MTIIASICARGGSKGLPRKNLLDFHGRPLIAHSIAQALACAQIDGVYVSTDDAEIAEVARAAGAQVPFLRPAEMATDRAPKLPVIEHLVRHLEASGSSVDRVVDLQPTSPLRTSADVAGALSCSPDAPLVLSVTAARDSPYFNMVEETSPGVLRLCQGTGFSRRQDLPAVYALNGSIYVWHRFALARAAERGMWSVPAAPFLMERWKSVDIDDADDFAYAHWLYARRLAGVAA